MKTFIHYLCILISVLTIASCENDLPFNVKDNPPKLVMNALINADSLTNIVFLNLTGKELVCLAAGVWGYEAVVYFIS